MIKYKVLFYILAVVIIIVVVVLGPRMYKDIKLKKDKENTYAIQNLKTNKCIRPYNAGFQDDNKIILYSLNNWECITWQYIEIEDNTYLLQNLYTEKTFQPEQEPKEGVTMVQKPLEASKMQYWEFLQQDDGNYLIRLKDTDLYLTAKSEEQNSEITLETLQNTDEQKWNLVKQNPIV